MSSVFAHTNDCQNSEPFHRTTVCGEIQNLSGVQGRRPFSPRSTCRRCLDERFPGRRRPTRGARFQKRVCPTTRVCGSTTGLADDEGHPSFRVDIRVDYKTTQDKYCIERLINNRGGCRGLDARRVSARQDSLLSSRGQHTLDDRGVDASVTRGRAVSARAPSHVGDVLTRAAPPPF